MLLYKTGFAELNGAPEAQWSNKGHVRSSGTSTWEDDIPISIPLHWVPRKQPSQAVYGCTPYVCVRWCWWCVHLEITDAHNQVRRLVSTSGLDPAMPCSLCHEPMNRQLIRTQCNALTAFLQALFRWENGGEKHCIRIPVAFRLYLVKIIQILTN
jgi:hypothetical protein